jgi:hypothetical protein
MDGVIQRFRDPFINAGILFFCLERNAGVQIGG